MDLRRQHDLGDTVRDTDTNMAAWTPKVPQGDSIQKTNPTLHLGHGTSCCCFCSESKVIVRLGTMMWLGPMQAPGTPSPQPSAELLCRHLGHDHQACSWRAMPQLCFPPPTPSRASASSSGGSRSQAGPMGQAVASVVAQAPGRPRDAPSTNTCSFVHLGCTLAVLLYLLQLQCLQFHFSARWTTPFCHLSHLSITCSFIKLASHVSQSPMYHTVYYFVQTALHANAYCNESLIWFKVSGVPQTLKYCRDSS